MRLVRPDEPGSVQSSTKTTCSCFLSKVGACLWQLAHTNPRAGEHTAQQDQVCATPRPLTWLAAECVEGDSEVRKRCVRTWR